MQEMRRKDRLVTDFDTVVKVIDECETVRLAFSDGEYPYIVPLNFGYEVVDEKIYLYVHGAMEGRKFELMKKNGKCSFEMDKTIKMELLPEHGDVTTRYKSLYGIATIDLLEGEERQRAIDEFIMGRHEETRDFAYNKAKVPYTMVARLNVTDYSCKINGVKGGPD